MNFDLKRGMDHSLYRFQPMPGRPYLIWPKASPLALSVVLYLDYWELATATGQHRPPDVQGMWGHQYPDLRTFSYRLYGERIGVFRILEVLQRHGIIATIAVGSEICKRYPHIIEACVAAGHEIAAHGTHATRMITSRMSEQEEREHIELSREAIFSATGSKPKGWFGQDQGESTCTPDLVSEAGFEYLADWPNDDQPYWLTLKKPIISMPLHTELDDLQLLWMRQQPTWKYPTMVEDAARQLIQDGKLHGRVLSLGLRSWLFGRPHRIKYLDEALKNLKECKSIWQASANDIVQAYKHAIPYSHAQSIS